MERGLIPRSKATSHLYKKKKKKKDLNFYKEQALFFMIRG